MNKTQLASDITQYLRDNGFTLGKTVSGATKEVSYRAGEDLLAHILVTFQQVVATGHTIRIPELGTFKTVVRKARTARNPKTNEKVNVDEKKVLRYRMSKEMKSILNLN